MGRLVTTLASIGVGGATGMLAVGGLAAIGLEIKQIVDFSESLDSSLQKVNDQFAAMVPGAKRLADIGELNRVLSSEGTEADKKYLPEQPGLFARFGSRVQGFFQAAFSPHGTGETTGDVEQGFITETEAALATVLNIEHQSQAERTEQTKEAEDKRLRIVTESNLALAKVSGASASAIERLQETLDGLKDSADALSAGRTTELRLLTDLSTITSKVAGDLPALTSAIQGLHVAALDLSGLGTLTKPSFTVGAVPSDFDLKMLARPETPKDLAMRGVLKTGVPGKTATIGSGLTELALALPGILASMTGGGGAGGAVTGFGGLLTGLSGVKGLGLASLGPAGALIGAAGGLLSLFGGSGHKMSVQIDSYTTQALEQMKNLRADPTTRDVIVIGNDPRNTMAQVARLSRKGAINRGT